MMKAHFPFKVGQYAEARTFLRGYRGAWFRCKIVGIVDKCMKLGLEYYDFPEEKIEWKRLYNKRHKLDKKEHLMVRPPYPPVCCEGELLEIRNDPEVVVVVNEVWKEGDLVDWWRDGCYWSGKLTKKLTEETFQIDLWPKPIGEGSSYEADCKDLRPSLAWSPEHGWTLPLQKGGKTVLPCARLIHPKMLQAHSADEGRKVYPVTTKVREHRTSNSSRKEERCSSRSLTEQSRGMASNHDRKGHRINEGPSKTIHPADEGRKGNHVVPKAQVEPKPSSSGTSKGGCSGGFLKDRQGGMASNDDGKDQLVDEPSSKRARSEVVTLNPTHSHSSTTAAGIENRKDQVVDEPSSKQARSDSVTQNFMHLDTIDASILDLEELLCRVKWIKSIMQRGTDAPNSPQWKYVVE